MSTVERRPSQRTAPHPPKSQGRLAGRLAGRVWVIMTLACVLITVTVSGYPAFYTGIVASAGFTVLALAMLFTSWTAVRMILAGRYDEHRRWLIRSFSLLLAIWFTRRPAEVSKGALGYNQINLLTESAGTRTAMIYAWRYPQRASTGR